MKYSNRHISDDELDQLFRDAHASEGQEPLFVPEFWSEMEALLPAEKTKKRGFYWIPVAATALVFSIILLYPAETEQVDTIARHDSAAGLQSQQNEKNSRSELKLSQNESEAAQSQLIKPVSNRQDTESSSANTVTNHQKRIEFRAERNNHSNDSQVDINRAVEPVEVPPVTDEPLIVDAQSVASTEALVLNELDSVRLEARYEQIPQEEIAGLPKNTPNESSQWYAELGPTIGQSPYLSPNEKRNVVGGAVLGGGYTKRIDNAFVSFGLQARMEGFGGLDYQETNFSAGINRKVSVKQLYSLEVPLKFGFAFRRSEFGFGVVPGVQLFIHGKETITENQQVTRQSSFTGKVEHSNSLTMEIGLQYYYNLTPRLSLGAKLNADILRPFHTDYYLGKSAGFPVNGQIVLRRSFWK